MNNVPELYSWLVPTWRQIQAYRSKQRLSHALLITGMPGLGQHNLAQYLAKSLLCKNKTIDQKPCNCCRACAWHRASTHPCLLEVTQETPKQGIKIDQIRDIHDFLSTTVYQDQHQIVLINPAEAMTLSACQALLKILEEPSGVHTLFLLVSERSNQLPATIRSRCTTFCVQPPTSFELDAFLQGRSLIPPDYQALIELSGSSPLKILEWSKAGHTQQRETIFNGLLALAEKRLSPVELADQCQQWDLNANVLYLMSVVIDLIRLSCGATDATLMNTNLRKCWPDPNGCFRIEALFHYFDQLLQMQRELSQSIQLNKSLWLTNIFIGWSQLVEKVD